MPPSPKSLPDANPGGPEAQSVEETIVEQERPAYRRQVEQLLARGYAPGLELAEAAYTGLQILRLRTKLEENRANNQPTTVQEARAMGDLQATQRSQMVQLDRRMQSQGDPDHDLRAAEDWIREHLGEFASRCSGCGMILTPTNGGAPALPHWALASIDRPNQPKEWMVWSQDLWELVLDGTISLWVMALTLRCSPEALKITAERRGMPWPEAIDLEAEETALAIRLQAVDRRLMKEATQGASP